MNQLINSNANEQANAGAKSAQQTVADIRYTVPPAEGVSFSKAGDAAYRGRTGRSGHYSVSDCRSILLKMMGYM